MECLTIDNKTTMKCCSKVAHRECWDKLKMCTAAATWPLCLDLESFRDFDGRTLLPHDNTSPQRPICPWCLNPLDEITDRNHVMDTCPRLNSLCTPLRNGDTMSLERQAKRLATASRVLRLTNVSSTVTGTDT